MFVCVFVVTTNEHLYDEISKLFPWKINRCSIFSGVHKNGAVDIVHLSKRHAKNREVRGFNSEKYSCGNLIITCQKHIMHVLVE